MEAQSYKNHVRYYPMYHFVMVPLGVIVFILAVYLAFKHDLVEGLFYLLLSVLVVLSTLVARIYALILQNRLIRTEFRLRYERLAGKSFDEIETRLRNTQIFALRFASDEELPALIEEAINHNLLPDEIKRRIKHWKADNYRV